MRPPPYSVAKHVHAAKVGFAKAVMMGRGVRDPGQGKTTHLVLLHHLLQEGDVLALHLHQHLCQRTTERNTMFATNRIPKSCQRCSVMRPNSTCTQDVVERVKKNSLCFKAARKCLQECFFFSSGQPTSYAPSTSALAACGIKHG
jgi:hypothetical protein